VPQRGACQPDDAGLYTARASDATDLVRLSTTLPGGFDLGYSYSPDGSRVLIAQYDASSHGQLRSVAAAGGDPVALSPQNLSVVDLGFFDRVGADWSPDGGRVTFAAHDLSGPRSNSAVYVVNADGSHLRRITPPGVGGLSAQWAPDGERIAFTSGCCGLPGAWTIRPDGSGLRQVAHPANHTGFLTPVWSPDSTALLLNRLDRQGQQASLWTVNADGSHLLKLADTVSPSLYDWGRAPSP
jgi:dipeptidyl aminopeptidase/acylaminoacyl peptidase